MEIAGIPVTVGMLGSVLSAYYSAVQGINTLHQKHKFMSMILASIVTTCNMTKFALERVDHMFQDKYSTSRRLLKQLTEVYDGIKIGCATTLSILERHVIDLLDVTGSDLPLATRKISER